MFRKKTNLRKLIDSISKEDFEVFKAAMKKKTAECEIVKKLYEKLTGQPLLDNRIGVTIKISKVDDLGPDNKYTVIITEFYYNGVVVINSKYSPLKIAFDDEDIRNALVHFGNHLYYSHLTLDRVEAVINEYIDNKELIYDVDLDNETYRKLRLLVESL